MKKKAMQEVIKIGMAMDDYKVNDLTKHWTEAMKDPRFINLYPHMDKYQMIESVMTPGPYPLTTLVTRTYKLIKEEKA